MREKQGRVGTEVKDNIFNGLKGKIFSVMKVPR
jgi:hypothetical protein